MEVASGKNRQNTKENAKIWQYLLKATTLVPLNSPWSGVRTQRRKIFLAIS